MTRFHLEYFDDIKLSQQLETLDDSVTELVILDHLGGFDSNLHNTKLERINNFAKHKNKIVDLYVSNFMDVSVTKKYSNLTFKLSVFPGLKQFFDYNIHPNLEYKNFICSFNGTPHVGRKFLVCALKKFGFFNPEYCSKNFALSKHNIDGHLNDFVADKTAYYNKFFSIDEDFLKSIYSFGHVRFDHKTNIYNLESKLTQSFLHIVSETLPTSYVPLISEKFLYSVITRGLFLAYAQPGWHGHLEKCYGFKKYVHLFDYGFDSVQNPVERLIALLTMVSKYSNLSVHDWHDLYLLESDTVEFNYDWYFSKDWLKKLEASSV